MATRGASVLHADARRIDSNEPFLCSPRHQGLRDVARPRCHRVLHDGAWFLRHGLDEEPEADHRRIQSKTGIESPVWIVLQMCVLIPNRCPSDPWASPQEGSALASRNPFAYTLPMSRGAARRFAIRQRRDGSRRPRHVKSDPRQNDVPLGGHKP
jgi:hypothetical protein